MSFIYSIMSLVLVIIAIGLPVIITILLLKRVGRGPNSNEDYLLEKIRELEARIKVLEDERF